MNPPPLPVDNHPADTVPDDAIIVVRNLYRHFGAVRAVNGLNFTIRKGEVVGFIGANGAGKTTTMRILATLDRADSGFVSICGHNVRLDPDAVRRRIGWMPDDMQAYPGMLVIEYLDFFARAYGLRGEQRRARVEEILEFTELKPLVARPCKGLSKGQTQRLCLARALLNDPDILILDEPAAGLDPKARLEFKNLVRLLRDQGKTLFISSHILSELGEMCTNLIFVDGGRLVHQGDADSLKYGTHSNAAGTVRVVVRTRFDADETRVDLGLERLGEGYEIQRSAEGCSLAFDCPTDGVRPALADLLARLVAEGLRPYDFHREERRLEDAFVSMLKQPPPLPGRPSGR